MGKNNSKINLIFFFSVSFLIYFFFFSTSLKELDFESLYSPKVGIWDIKSVVNKPTIRKLHTIKPNFPKRARTLFLGRNLFTHSMSIDLWISIPSLGHSHEHKHFYCDDQHKPSIIGSYLTMHRLQYVMSSFYSSRNL